MISMAHGFPETAREYVLMRSMTCEDELSPNKTGTNLVSEQKRNNMRQLQRDGGTESPY